MTRQRCPVCPYVDQPLVTGIGKPNGIAIVGEAPGVNEVQQKKPFVGRSGQLLRETLRAFGVNPEDVYITNSVICHPPGNATPTPKIYMGCRSHLMMELREVNPTKILSVGGTALSALIGSEKGLTLSRNRGQGMWVDIGGSSVSDREHPVEFYDHEPIYMVPTWHPAAILRDNDLFRDFRDDIEKFLSHDQPIDSPRIHIIVPKTSDEALSLLQLVQSASILSCDLETTGLDPISDRIISFGFGAMYRNNPDYDGVAVLLRREIVSQEVAYEMLNILNGGYKGVLVFHNAKFDLQFLEMFYHGIRLRPHHLADTMLMKYAQDERPAHGEDGRRGYSSQGLKVLARVKYDIPDYKMAFDPFVEKLNKGTLTEEEWDNFLRYHAMDCYITARLYEDLERELNEESPKLMKLHDEVLIPGTIMLSEIELTGVKIDTDYMTEISEVITSRLTQLITEIQEDAVNLSHSEEWRSLNPNSPKKIGELLFGVLQVPSQTRSTEKEALQSIARVTTKSIREFIEKLLEYRRLSKMKGTFIDGISQRLGTDDRVRTDFFVNGTSTGRLSSGNPNLQNIPVLIGDQIRTAFVAPEGWVFVGSDYKQLENRVGAWYSKDPALIEMFKSGRDIHRETAAKLFHKPAVEITFYERYITKYMVHGASYGRQAKGLVEGAEMDYFVDELHQPRMTIKQAQEFLDEFFAQFPIYKKWMDSQHRLVRQQRYTETETGRRRRFPLMSAETVFAIERQAVNSPIQGFASDICLMSAVRLHGKLDPEKAHILFLVHDSIEFEIRRDYIDEALEIIRFEMEENLPFDTSILPFRVDIEIGRDWGHLLSIEKWREQCDTRDL